MQIKNYPEKKIRKQIINKINPIIKKSRSSHQKGYVYLNGILITKVKIPNEHDRIMKKSKSQFIASSLRLSYEELNDLIDCSMSGKKYLKLLKDRI